MPVIASWLRSQLSPTAHPFRVATLDGVLVLLAMLCGMWIVTVIGNASLSPGSSYTLLFADSIIFAVMVSASAGLAGVIASDAISNRGLVRSIKRTVTWTAGLGAGVSLGVWLTEGVMAESLPPLFGLLELLVLLGPAGAIIGYRWFGFCKPSTD